MRPLLVRAAQSTSQMACLTWLGLRRAVTCSSTLSMRPWADLKMEL
jgi:hypothetical protein